MDLFLLNEILIIVVNILGIWLGISVYLNDRESRVNRAFFMMIFFGLGWITVSYLCGMVFYENYSLSLLLAKISYGTAAIFLIPFYLFFSYFTKSLKRDFFFIFVFAGGIALALMSILTDLMVVDMVSASVLGFGAGAIPVLGHGQYIWFSFAFIVSFAIIIKILKQYKKKNSTIEPGFRYVLLGSSVFIFLNVFFNVIFPLIIGDVRYYQLGNYSIMFMFGFTGYAIVKDRLFDIKVAVTDLLVVLFGVVLFVFAFLLGELTTPMRTALFFGFLIMGYFLSKYTRAEVARKENLEKIVQERVKDLERSHNETKKAYQEMKEEKEKIEKFYKLTTGRELKMIELKKKIRRLQKKLEKQNTEK